ncbi:MAG TPA: site-2 protease family protein [Candidatus Angelobacter sp.]|nr:site-2 protease family protein [Candidatus Angelobacter sp.]
MNGRAAVVRSLLRKLWRRASFPLSVTIFLVGMCKYYGPALGLGFTVILLVHEMGHFTEAKRRGLPVNYPVFILGLGAYVEINAADAKAEALASMKLAGPVAGCAAAVVCTLMWLITKGSTWAALAREGAFLNLFNLIPLWILDGAMPMVVISKLQTAMLLVSALALWQVLDERVFFYIAVGIMYRWLMKMNRPTGGPNTRFFVCYGALVIIFAAIVWLVPASAYKIYGAHILHK